MNSDTAPDACRPVTCQLAGCGDGVIDNGEDCDDANGTDWDGCTSCAITEFLVNTTTGSMQEGADVAMAPDGRFVVVWMSLLQDGDRAGVFCQRYDATGMAVGGEFQVNTTTLGDQGNPAVAMAADGTFVVVWVDEGHDGDGEGIFGQRYDASGAALGGEFQVNTTTTGIQESPAVAMAPDGAFVVAWQSYGQDGDSMGIYAQRYNANGTVAGGEFQVNTATAGSQSTPSVAVASDGRFVVAWFSDANSAEVFAQRYDAGGAALGGEFQVNTYTTSWQQNPAVAMAPDGRFVVTWGSDGQDGDSMGIYAQRYNADGTVAGGEFQVNTVTADAQVNPSVAMASDGRFVVTWDSMDMSSLDSLGRFGQRFGPNGATVGAEFALGTYSSVFDEGTTPVAMASDGRFVVAWQSYGQDGDEYGIFAQRYDASGNALGVLPW